MKTTGNLGLKKPEGTDIVDINDLNGNMDILDTAVKAAQDHTADTTKHITATERTAWNGKASTTAATASAAGLMSAADKSKLDGVAAGANAYTHPATHPPSIIVQDSSNRFTTDAEKAAWNAKASTSVATTSANGLMSAADKVQATNLASLPTSTGSSSAYAITVATGTALTAGLRLTFKAHVASSAFTTPTLNPGGLGAKYITKPDASLPKLLQNGVYTVVYDGAAFQLQGEGGGVDLNGTNAVPEHVLVNDTFFSSGSTEMQAGTLEDFSGLEVAAVVASASGGNLAVQPWNFNTGFIDQDTLFIVSDGSLTSANIMAGRNVLGVPGAATNDATATAADIASNKSAYVNGSKVWGTVSLDPTFMLRGYTRMGVTGTAMRRWVGLIYMMASGATQPWNLPLTGASAQMVQDTMYIVSLQRSGNTDPNNVAIAVFGRFGASGTGGYTTAMLIKNADGLGLDINTQTVYNSAGASHIVTSMSPLYTTYLVNQF